MLKTTIAIALICGFALSWRLWISSRLFPLSPVSQLLPTIPSPLDKLWLSVLIGMALAIAVVVRPRRLTVCFLGLAGLLSLWDQNRWQPWFYQYFFMLAATVFARRMPETQNHQNPLNACRVIVVSTYFWSGLQKLNVNFVRETWPDVATPLLRVLPKMAGNIPSFLILMIPLLEIAIGLGLTMRPLRNASVVMAIATHVFVLVLLISSGENTVVWPWNIAMILLVVTLFWQERSSRMHEMIASRNSFHALVLLLFGILPALSFLGLWDSYLSSALYSGNTDQAVIYLSPDAIHRVPMAVHPHIWQNTLPFFLDVNRWSYGELNVPLYPEPRIYRRVAAAVCAYAGGSTDVRLRIKEKPNLFTGIRESQYYDCEHLE